MVAHKFVNLSVLFLSTILPARGFFKSSVTIQTSLRRSTRHQTSSSRMVKDGRNVEEDALVSVGMGSVSKLYDSFIIDQWGVLHDGKTPYPGVTECLENLKSCGKKLVLLSNSSKRKSTSFKGLNKVGINSLLFDDIVTSGEMAWNAIIERKFDFPLQNYKTPAEKLKVFVVGNNDEDVEYVTSCNCVLSPPETADFVLARGTFCTISGLPSGNPENLVAYSKAEDLVASIGPFLSRCIAMGLPMLVSNPDFHRPGSGAPMPGQIGRKYSELGGTVQYIGKPYGAVYDTCLSVLTAGGLSPGLTPSTLGSEVDRTRVCGVGDSLDHDILGAERAGIASIWTANGVHSGEMQTAEGSSVLASDNILEDMYLKYGVKPSHTISSFKW
jgi:HAD superfamily hydrolase (TIGR01450 family)